MASIFSRIIAGEIPSYKVAEDEKFYAFLDIQPLAPGHTLVVPKKEVDYYFDMDDDEVGEIMVFSKKIAQRIKKLTGCKKVAVMIFGLEVPHAHVHLIPVNQPSDADFSRPKLEFTPEEFQQMCEHLKE